MKAIIHTATRHLQHIVDGSDTAGYTDLTIKTKYAREIVQHVANLESHRDLLELKLHIVKLMTEGP